MDTKSLTAEDWLTQALKSLKSEGYASVKALPLAKKLGVTRGSFYHHFDSMDEFHAALIAHWSRFSSAQMIQSTHEEDDPAQALDTLLQATLNTTGDLERAMRSWSTVQPLVAKEVAKVDAARIKAAEDLLVRSGLDQPRASSRARLMYWAAIGRLMLPFPDTHRLTPAEISDFARLMLRA